VPFAVSIGIVENLICALTSPLQAALSPFPMKKDAVLAKLKQQKVIAIIRAESSDGLLDCAKALAAGGLTAIELTMTTPAPSG